MKSEYSSCDPSKPMWENLGRYLWYKHVVHEILVDGSSMIGFPLVKADSERNMPGIKPGPPDWDTSALTNELQEVRIYLWQNCVEEIMQSLTTKVQPFVIV